MLFNDLYDIIDGMESSAMSYGAREFAKQLLKNDANIVGANITTTDRVHENEEEFHPKTGDMSYIPKDVFVAFPGAMSHKHIFVRVAMDINLQATAIKEGMGCLVIGLDALKDKDARFAVGHVYAAIGHIHQGMCLLSTVVLGKYPARKGHPVDSGVLENDYNRLLTALSDGSFNGGAILLTKAQLSEVRRIFAEKQSEGPGTYIVGSRDCIGFAHDILRELGIKSDVASVLEAAGVPKEDITRSLAGKSARVRRFAEDGSEKLELPSGNGDEPFFIPLKIDMEQK